MAFCCISALAQSPVQKTVCLYDGTRIKGTVTINDSAGYVMVMDRQHVPHYYDSAMVRSIEEPLFAPVRIYAKARGYAGDIEAGGMDIIPSRTGGSGLHGFSMNVVNSWFFSPYASLGLGLGTELSGSGNNIEMISAYADSRIYFMKSNIGPYLDIAVGYEGMFLKYTDYDTFSLHPPSVREQDNGLMFNPSLGVRVALNRNVSMTASMGYKLYYLLSPDNTYSVLSDNPTFSPDAHGFYLFNAVTITAGFQF